METTILGRRDILSAIPNSRVQLFNSRSRQGAYLARPVWRKDPARGRSYAQPSPPLPRSGPAPSPRLAPPPPARSMAHKEVPARPLHSPRASVRRPRLA